jgi:phenol/toluene 2-monooxygenase (NADH) P0/A0
MQAPPFRRWSAEPPDADVQATEQLRCDTTRRFVRVIEERSDGLVFFEFSIGWPELAVELLLPRPAFDEFCATNHVMRLDGESAPTHPEETQG